MHGAGVTMLTLPTLDREGRPTWQGLWLAREGIRWLGPRPPSSLLAEGLRITGATADLVNLLQVAARSYLERLETLEARLGELEEKGDSVALRDLATLHRSYRAVRVLVGRLTIALAELDGPLGERFTGLARALPPLQGELSHLEGFSSGLGQGIRDLLSLRTAGESNRLSEATNRLAEVSNRIAALANTSNIRMLGIAAIALVLALVAAVVLIPNTGATILGMPSAAWVPGIWIDGIMVVLAVVPLVLVFSRPWVRTTLRGLASFEARTAEGVRDLPELPPDQVDRRSVDESLLGGPR